MFTGIIEELGVVKDIRKDSKGARLSISAKTVLDGLKIGDSITVNGVCLTAVSISTASFEADVAPETLKKTNLSELKSGSKVNLERALKLSDRLGGHLVTGHKMLLIKGERKIDEAFLKQHGFSK
ncbi:MAG: riboflavin synthase [Nitrospirae bacterium]|nr:riboflavin synthase [Nitrospirota bacterium]